MTRVGVIGSSDVGKVLAKGFKKHGYEVEIGSREGNKLAAWSAEAGIAEGTFAAVASKAEVVVLAIAGAEYVLRWLPRGTHDWKKFLKPSEVVRGLRGGDIETREIVGVVYSPLSRTWSLNTGDLDVNYMLYGTKAP